MPGGATMFIALAAALVATVLVQAPVGGSLYGGRPASSDARLMASSSRRTWSG